MFLFVSHSISLLHKIVHLCFFKKICFSSDQEKNGTMFKNHAVPFCALGDFQQASDMPHHVSYSLFRNSTMKFRKTWWELPGHFGTSLITPWTCQHSWKFLFIIFHSLCYRWDSYCLLLLNSFAVYIIYCSCNMTFIPILVILAKLTIVSVCNMHSR